MLVNTILMYHISLQWPPSVHIKELRRPRLMSSLHEMASVTPCPHYIAKAKLLPPKQKEGKL